MICGLGARDSQCGYQRRFVLIAPVYGQSVCCAAVTVSPTHHQRARPRLPGANLQPLVEVVLVGTPHPLGGQVAQVGRDVVSDAGGPEAGPDAAAVGGGLSRGTGQGRTQQRQHHNQTEQQSPESLGPPINTHCATLDGPATVRISSMT